jgi:hypothetical protein
MGYETFGHYHDREIEDVIKSAKKQQRAEDVAHALVSPLSFAVKKGVGAAVGRINGHAISTEELIRAIVLQVLRDYHIIPKQQFKNQVREIVLECLREENMVAPHPHWKHRLKVNGHKNHGR